MTFLVPHSMRARMSEMTTILISSAGRRIQLMDCFRQSAMELGVPVRVIAADLRPDLSPACQKADAFFPVPRCTTDDYIPALLKLCREQAVNLLVPTIDPELAVLSEHAAAFGEVGTRVMVSDPDVVRLANNKLATSKFLAAAGVRPPTTVQLSDYRRNPGVIQGPVIAKPNAGSASVGIVRGESPADFKDLPDLGYVVQELWQGREYTVNVFFDQSGKLRSAVPHERIEVRSGEVSKGRTERVPALMDAARKLAANLPGPRGALCFQAVVKDSGEFAVFEINARFGGGYPLAHRAGARFTQWLLEETAGLPCSANDDWKEGVLMLRYDEAVFVGD